MMAHQLTHRILSNRVTGSDKAVFFRPNTLESENKTVETFIRGPHSFAVEI